MSHFYKLKVSDVQRLTPKAVTISFHVPDELKEKYAFQAGQYITLKKTINNSEVRRDYSLCVPPLSDQLQIAVKEVEGGTFSVFANKELMTGDELEVGTPNGRFVFIPNDYKTKNIALFAAGSGITPILSIIRCALEEETYSKVILVYGNKSLEDTMFLKELKELQQNYKDRFSIQFVFSQTDAPDAIFGRIEKSTVNYVMKNKHKHIDVDAFYLCGPEGMIHTVKDVLVEHDIPEDRIHFELFKAAKTEQNQENTESGECEITVLVDDESKTFRMSNKQSILDAALDQDLDAPYSCQGGICSSCIARIKEGEARMRQNNILTENEVAEGLILTCQAHPTSSKIIVDYDDV